MISDKTRQAREETIREVLELLGSEQARHEIVDMVTGEVEELGNDHKGPTLMSAALWAMWLKRRLGWEGKMKCLI